MRNKYTLSIEVITALLCNVMQYLALTVIVVANAFMKTSFTGPCIKYCALLGLLLVNLGYNAATCSMLVGVEL